MKNIEVLYTPDEIRTRLKSLFKTELFKREAERPGSLVNRVVEHAAEYPLFFYDMSDHPSKDTPKNEKTEWSQLTAWFGGVARRHYDNPAINDLALLHELYHKGYMAFEKGMSFEAFKRKMFDNELEASVTSELEIYFNHPEFRKQSFKQEIFADRFLRDENFMKRWQQNPERMRAHIRERRRDAMHHAEPGDQVQFWINKFALQNDAFANTWSTRYDQVETAMHDLHEAIDLGADRKASMDKFMAWVQSSEVTKGTEMPFPDEAKAFSGIYLLNKRHYSDAVTRGDMQQQGIPSIMSQLRQHYPDLSPKQALADPVAKEVLGPIPHYSNRTDYQMTNVTTLMPGSFAVMYAETLPLRGAKSRKTDDLRVILEIRGEKTPDGKEQYGMCGGYTNVDFLLRDDGIKHTHIGEQPADGAIREIREELTDDKGKPIITPSADRLKLLSAGHDYRKRPGTSYTGFALQLTSEEFARIQTHAERMETDATYRESAIEASNGEVRGVRIMALKDALALQPEQFTHPHELTALQILADRLKQPPEIQRIP